jgi:hypothetical protein
MLLETINHPNFAEMAAETLFFVFLWQFFFIGFLMPRIYSYVSRQDYWKSIVKRKGNLAINGQTDIVLMALLALHHGTAGSMLLIASVINSGFLWKHGALMELGFEIADDIAIIRGVWPHEPDKVALDLRIAFFFHHMPGILFLFPLIMNNFHENHHLQTIGGWLLFVASISCISGGYVYTRDFDKPAEMKQAAIAQFIGWASFMFARWIVFPMEVYALYNEVSERSDLDPNFAFMVKAMGCALGVFNLLVSVTITPKTARYLNRAFIKKDSSLGDELPDTNAKKIK